MRLGALNDTLCAAVTTVQMFFTSPNGRHVPIKFFTTQRASWAQTGQGPWSLARAPADVRLCHTVPCDCHAVGRVEPLPAAHDIPIGGRSRTFLFLC